MAANVPAEAGVPSKRLRRGSGVRKGIAIVGGAVFCAGLVAVLAIPAKQSTSAHLAPRIAIASLDHRGTFTLSQFKGRPLVLNFWRQACTPCATEEPVLASAFARYKQSVAFAGVDIGDTTASSGLAEARATGMDYPMGFDPTMSLVGPYGIVGTPVTVFISADGTIVSKITGPLTVRILANNITLMSRSSR